jgi:hypothetical protein
LKLVTDVSVELAASAIMALVPDPEDAVSQLSGSFVPVGPVCWHHENLADLHYLLFDQNWNVSTDVNKTSQYILLRKFVPWFTGSCMRTDGDIEFL